MAQAEEETRSRSAIVIKPGGRYVGKQHPDLTRDLCWLLKSNTDVCLLDRECRIRRGGSLRGSDLLGCYSPCIVSSSWLPSSP